MAGFIVFFVLCVLCLGAVAFVFVIVLFNKISKIEDRLNAVEKRLPSSIPQFKPLQQEVVTQSEHEILQREPVGQIKPQASTSSSENISQQHQTSNVNLSTSRFGDPVVESYAEKEKTEISQNSLELKIGTRFILIAGIITVIFGVGYFLKYVYENYFFSPAARVTLVAAAGFAAIIIGDILRRKKFEVVARGITALGFAMLYAAVFSGNRVYALFDTKLAFSFSILITAGAMAYAVVLDEILIAFLSLLGGYLAPAIISTGQNLPIPLFGYVLVLGAGAMGCAMFRRWKAVNWIAMAGTWLLYTAWFEKFYTDDQSRIALVWLGVFACVYLIMPILYGLIRRIEARSEDVTLVVLNSIIAFYHLWRVLGGEKSRMAVAAVLLGVLHLSAMFVVLWRCRSDKSLRAALGVVGIAFITAAIPMYFKLNAALVGWSIEAAALTFIGIRYQSLWTQTMGIVAGLLSAAGLFYHLPLHATVDFKVFLNPAAGTWAVVAAGLFVCHLLWRFMKNARTDEGSFVCQILFAAAVLILATGASLEWHEHCRRHMVYDTAGWVAFLKGMIVAAIFVIAAFAGEPVSPDGKIVRSALAAAAVCGSLYTAIAMTRIYYDDFKLFLNVPFALAFGFCAVLLWAAWKLRRDGVMSAALVLSSMVLFWILLSDQVYLFWKYKNMYGPVKIENWKLSAHMFMSIGWAIYAALLMIIGFVKRAKKH